MTSLSKSPRASHMGQIENQNHPQEGQPPTKEWSIQSVRDRLTGRNLALFFVFHELMGIGYALSLVAICYRVRPTARLLNTEGGKRIVERAKESMQGRKWGAFGRSGTWENVKQTTFKFSKKASGIFPEKYRPEPTRLMAAAGEQVIVRRCLTPISVPGKIVLSCWAVEESGEVAPTFSSSIKADLVPNDHVTCGWRKKNLSRLEKFPIILKGIYKLRSLLE